MLCYSYQRTSEAGSARVEARLINSRSWLASDDPYGSFADYCASRAAMKTCFVVLEQSENDRFRRVQSPLSASWTAKYDFFAFVLRN